MGINLQNIMLLYHIWKRLTLDGIKVIKNGEGGKKFV